MEAQYLLKEELMMKELMLQLQLQQMKGIDLMVGKELNQTKVPLRSVFYQIQNYLQFLMK